MSVGTTSVGFLWATVFNNKDPDGTGRVLFTVPGLFEPHHPEWAHPIGWPASGGLTRGSFYPIERGAQIAVFFEQGETSAPPGYMAATYGTQVGLPAGPPMIAEVYRGAQPSGQEGGEETPQPNDAAAEAVLGVTVIWEDDAFRVFIVNDEDDKRLVMVDKKTGSGMVLNATDGAQGASVSLTLSANTSLSLQSNGLIDIRGSIVQIQGRRVMTKPGVTSI